MVVLLLIDFRVFADEFEGGELDDPFELDESTFDLTISEFESEVDESSGQWRLSFSWQNSADLNALDNVRSHRLDSRLTWEQLVFGDYFFKIDGKIIFRLPGDDNQVDQSGTEFDGRLRELYVQNSGELWTFTAGYQVLNMGEMEAVQVVDILSPWDFSELAFTAPEDARLGQLFLNAEWYVGEIHWQLLYSPWPLTNRYPGGETNEVFQQLIGRNNVEIHSNQAAPFEVHEFLLRWKVNIEGSDISFFQGSLLSNDPIFIGGTSENSIETEYYRFNLFGIAANYSAGNFLWKIEAAYKQNMKFQSAPALESDAVDVAIGAEYDANGAWNMSVEIKNQRKLTPRKLLMGRLGKDDTLLAMRWRKSWLHDTLSSVLFVSYQWQYGDSIASVALDYVVDDNWKVSVAGSVFNSTDLQSPGQFTKDWDQIIFRVNFTY